MPVNCIAYRRRRIRGGIGAGAPVGGIMLAVIGIRRNMPPFYMFLHRNARVLCPYTSIS